MLTHQRLLIIEDVFLIALDIQRALEESNAAQAVFARDFAEAAALAERFGDFDLAIVNPPSKADFATASLLANAGPAIVVCSAGPVNLEGTPLEGAPLISKPFSDDQLLAACAAALTRRSAARSSGS